MITFLASHAVTHKAGYTLKQMHIPTPLGTMVAIADEQYLYLLEFVDRKNFEENIAALCKQTDATILAGTTAPLTSIAKELELYFAGQLTTFTTPIFLSGSSFTQRVWQELQKIPFGQTRSYAQLACAIDNPKAFRAVARANSMNRLAIIVPCHRVINTDGKLGGYSAGVQRKQVLLVHEKL